MLLLPSWFVIFCGVSPVCFVISWAIVARVVFMFGGVLGGGISMGRVMLLGKFGWAMLWVCSLRFQCGLTMNIVALMSS